MERLNTVLTSNVIRTEYRVHSPGKYYWKLLCVQCLIPLIVNDSYKVSCLKLPCTGCYSNRCGIN